MKTLKVKKSSKNIFITKGKIKMKKTLTLILALVVAATAMVSCTLKKQNPDEPKNDLVVEQGKEETNDQDELPAEDTTDEDIEVDQTEENQPEADENTNTEQVPGDETEPEENGDAVVDQQPEEGTVPETQPEETTPETQPEQNTAGSIDSASASQIIDMIYEKQPFEGPMLGTMEFDLSDKENTKHHIGLISTEKVKEAAMSMPMMGSFPYTLAIVRANSADDAKAVAQEMKDNVDTRKWICVEADDMQVVSYKDIVMLIMVGSGEDYEGVITSAQIVSAFNSICK